MRCLICCVCMKKEFDISCSVYQRQGEIRPLAPRKSNGKSHGKKTVNENYGTCCDRNRR